MKILHIKVKTEIRFYSKIKEKESYYKPDEEENHQSEVLTYLGVRLLKML